MRTERPTYIDETFINLEIYNGEMVGSFSFCNMRKKSILDDYSVILRGTEDRGIFARSEKKIFARRAIKLSPDFFSRSFIVNGDY